jgi:regulator of replication initiation timing
MTDNIITREVHRANTEAEAHGYVVELKDIGGGVGAILATAVAFSAWYSKHKNRNVKADKAEGNFIETMQGDNDRLVRRIAHLETSRDECHTDLQTLRTELATVKVQVLQTSVLEAENKHLRERLEEKDRQIEQKNMQIEDMIKALMAKDNYIMELTARVHALELRLSADETKFCFDCPRFDQKD